MVFLKNIPTRIGYSIPWNFRYNILASSSFVQLSYWIVKMVERAFFSKKFKYSSLMYSHVIFIGFEKLIFLKLFVYDGLLVNILYSFYKTIIFSKFFKKFPKLFYTPIVFSRSSQFASLPRPYFKSFFSKASKLTLVQQRARMVSSLAKASSKFLSFPYISVNSSIDSRFLLVNRPTHKQYLSTAAHISKSFAFFSKFKHLYFNLSHQKIPGGKKPFFFLRKKIFSRSKRFKFLSSLVFSGFFLEYMLINFVFIKKKSFFGFSSKNFLFKFFVCSSKLTKFTRKSQKLAFQAFSKRVSKLRKDKQLDYFTHLAMFRALTGRLLHKYRFYFRNPAFFYSYSPIFYGPNKFLSRYGRRFRLRRYLSSFGFSKRNIRFHKKVRKNNARFLLRGNTKVRVRGSKSFSHQSNKLKIGGERPKMTIFSGTAKRASSTFIEKFKKLIEERRSNSPVSVKDTSSAGGSLKKKRFSRDVDGGENVAGKNFSFSKRPTAYVDTVSRDKSNLKPKTKKFASFLRARKKPTNLSKKSFNKAKRFKRVFKSFSFKDLLPSNLYKKALRLYVKFNFLNRRVFYSMIFNWFRLNFSLLVPGYTIDLSLSLVFPVNMRSEILAKYITRKLEFHYTLNELVYPMLRTLRPFYKGFYIRASGRFSRAQRAMARKFSFGKVSFSTLGNSLMYSFKWTRLKYGVCSIKLWLLPFRNSFFKKSFYNKQLDKGFKLVLVDSFFEMFAAKCISLCLVELNFLNNVLRMCRNFSSFAPLVNFELFYFKFFMLKSQLSSFAQLEETDYACNLFMFYSLSFSSAVTGSFFYRAISSSGRASFDVKPFWFFKLLSSYRKRKKFRWFIPLRKVRRFFFRRKKRFSKKIFKF